MSNAEITALLIAVAGFLATAVLSIVAFFMRRTLTENDKDIAELKGNLTAANNKRAEDFQLYQDKLDKLRADYEAKLERFHERVGARIDKANEDFTRGRSSSHHDIDLGDEKLRNDLNSLREKVEHRLSVLEREFAEWKGTSRATFVSKEDFIRESTQLEARIVATRRTLEGVDEVLKAYLTKE